MISRSNIKLGVCGVYTALLGDIVLTNGLMTNHQDCVCYTVIALKKPDQGVFLLCKRFVKKKL